MASENPIDPALRIASVRLAVGDLARSVDFYERVLGLTLISREQSSALLGADPAHPALELVALPDAVLASPHSTGLFHVAWLHPSRAALADTIRRIVSARWSIDGASDHGVSEALYLSDPDGLGIEIYVDRPREQWQRPHDGRGVQMVTLPLDLDDLIAQAPAEPSVAIAPDTGVGHVHLKVSDVPRAVGFYRDALGLEEQALLPSAAFLSAGGYHHHVGLNSWQSRGAQAPPGNAPGLRLVELTLPDAGAIAALEQRLAERPPPSADRSVVAPQREGDRLTVGDPDGNSLSFTVDPPAERSAA